jgi:phosphatidylserine decarboxylase
VLTDDHPAIARVAWAPLMALLLATVFAWRSGGFDSAWPWALAVLLLAWKFRDTDRVIPAGALSVLAPVDGWVLSTHEVIGPDGAPQWRVRVLVDPFSVYSVRAPIEGQVLDPSGPGGPGRGLWLRDDEARAVALRITAPFGLGQPRATVAIGERVGHGARCGWLRAGVLATLWLPLAVEVPRQRFRRVRAGSSILGQLPANGDDASP